MTTLAAKLAAALAQKPDDLPRRYETAVSDCDDAWSAVEGAMQSGFITLLIDAMHDFRAAYDRKLALHRQLLKAA